MNPWRWVRAYVFKLDRGHNPATIRAETARQIAALDADKERLRRVLGQNVIEAAVFPPHRQKAPR